MSANRRVVVTGIGVLTPLGLGLKENWTNILLGKSAITSLDSLNEFKNLPCRVAGKIDYPNLIENLLGRNIIRKSDLKTISLANLYALAAADEAVKDSGWTPSENDNEQIRAGCSIATGMAGIFEISEAASFLNSNEKGFKMISPYFVTKILPNLSTGLISIKYKLKGPNHCVTTACAAGSHSILDSFNFIKNGISDLMICGATEACVHPVSIAGFSRMRALATKFNDTPEIASRPFDKDRNGFVMSEGAGCLILENLEHVRKRNPNKTIYAEILGGALNGDANHITNPSPDGNGAFRCMNLALKSSGIEAENLDYINAHATSTPAGDVAEINAIKELFKSKSNLDYSKIKEINISSLKGSLGHLLGAAGAVETIFTIMACKEKIIPPSINIEKLEPDLNIEQLPFLRINQKEKRVCFNDQERKILALKNSFGFGGTNVSLCLSTFKE